MAGKVVELDVREYHQRGEEPFAAIMQAVNSLQQGDVFVLVNSFEPLPLYRVMEGKGFAHEVEQVAPDNWRITFRSKQG